MEKTFQSFHKTWKKEQIDEEQRMKKNYDSYMIELKKKQESTEQQMKKNYDLYMIEFKKMQENTDEIYKHLLQHMIELSKHDDSHEFITAIQTMLDDVSKNKWKMTLYLDVLKKSIANPEVHNDKTQWPFGKKPLYFNFMD